MCPRTLILATVLLCLCGPPGTLAAEGPVAEMQPVVIEEWPVPWEESRPRDPYVGPDGAVWFVGQQGDYLARLDPESGEISGADKLATVDPESLELTEVDLPRDDARPRRLALTGDGAVWYVDYAEGYLGRLDPESGEIEEWPAPGGREARPYAMAADDRGRIWFVESGLEPNRLVGFDPESGRFFAAGEVPSGGGTVRHMVFHEPTRTLWFGADTNTIGRAKVP